MRLSRRNLFKLAGASTTAAVAGSLGFDLSDAAAATASLRTSTAKEFPSVCCFCSGGCGVIAQVIDGKLVHCEGDPDNPSNRGSNCSKGAAVQQTHDNDQRITNPMYRAPGSSTWEVKSWEWMINRIATLAKKTRDASFIAEENGVTVNRTEAIASLGASVLNNEDLYLISKFMRSMGVTYLEHQARICHSSTVAGLGPSFGRGAMTNHWTDFKNTDVALILGSNAAENHPVSFSWLQEARDKRGAKIIHVDPRFTRTSTRADLYCQIRSGTNIAFWGGLINYIIENEQYHKEYVISYTNAASVIKDGYSFDAETGLFDSFNEVTNKYDKANWDYELDAEGKVIKDLTLQHPRCVFQLMKKHYSRYTIDTVVNTTGAPKDKLVAVYKLFSSTGQPGKAGSILYAMGSTQHTSASQGIRCNAIVQLLLGNMGLPGGGVNAMRGHSNVQGSTDMALLYHYLPGYMPAVTAEWPTLADYNATTPAAPSYWNNRPKFLASLLKAWYGDAATVDNEFAYSFLPKGKKGGNYSHMNLFENLYAKASIKGLFVWGQNPVVAGPNSTLESKAMENLEWLVCCDPFANETSTFWKRPGADPATINTEVFLLPVTTFLEKEGTVTHSGRLIQYRWKAVDGPGNVRQESYILDRLVRRIKSLYAKSELPQDLPIKSMTWNYPDPLKGQGEFIDVVMREINGYFLEDIYDTKVEPPKLIGKKGTLVPSFAALKDDGTTSCGLWIYSGMYTEELGNRTKSRVLDDPGGWGAHPGWGFAWPANRRILYNRASADPSGKPWSKDREYIWWDPATEKWTGYDVPDFIGTVKPTDPLGDKPFIMQTDREGRLFAIKGLNDGPFPEHYEPVESPVKNVINKRQNNPAAFFGKEGSKLKGDPEKYPIVCSTWRVCEHFHTGAYSRNMPWLAELMPSSFVEMSEELAAEKGIKNGEAVEVVSARGAVKAVAMVTPRAHVFNVHGKNVHQVGMTWHFGYQGLVQGEIANNLTPHVGDANTSIPEYKAFLVDVRKVTI